VETGVQRQAADEATVYVVDDDAAVRDALALLLRSVALRTEPHADARSLLDAWHPGASQGCLLIDLRMPGMCGMELYLALRALGCRMPAVIMTGHGDVSVAVGAMKAGVFDFVEKPFRGQALIEVVQQALRQSARMLAATAAQQLADARAAKLTAREREVMARVVRGERNKEIARALCLSVRTVELHRARVMQKVDARTVCDLARIATLLPDAPVPERPGNGRASSAQAASRPKRPLW
jgi:FixJ family two-component response regulator